MVLKRAVITVQSVRARREKDVAYIRITAFNEHTNDGVVENLTKLKKEIGANFQGVVLDLRNNPGRFAGSGDRGQRYISGTR